MNVISQVGSSNVIEAKADVAASIDPSKRSIIDVVLGAQWGDEGKGKLVDILSSNYDICARVAGGSNAGHTIVVDVSESIILLSLFILLYNHDVILTSIAGC